MDTDWDPVMQLVADPADADYKLTDRQPLQVPTPPVSTSIYLIVSPPLTFSYFLAISRWIPCR